MSSTKGKKCLLLINVGTPESPNKKDVKKYLTEFLNDPMVVDLPFVLRKILVNGIIVPFRVNKSVKIYRELWGQYGRILDTISNSLTERLQEELSSKGIDVRYAMRYGSPNVEKVFCEIVDAGYEELIVLPMFPQQAMSTVGTSITEVERLKQKYCSNLKMRIIPPFYNQELYARSVASLVKNYDLSVYDHILFSYHGLPNSHIKKTHSQVGKQIPRDSICCDDKNPYSCEASCYRSQCFQTTENIAKQLNLSPKQYSTAFQSRLSRNWMRPFSDELIVQKANQGVKSILVFALAFTIDCLETVNEIGEEYRELFEKQGGEKLHLVSALNDTDEMVCLVRHLVEKID